MPKMELFSLVVVLLAVVRVSRLAFYF